jgi:acyl transferase domain-containing protein
MISVNLGMNSVWKYLERTINNADMRLGITVACINSPINVTLSGDECIIDFLKTRLDEDDIFSIKLKTGMAYHSPAMEAIALEYSELMGELASSVTGPSNIPMISTVTGEFIEPKLLSRAQYWVRNLVSPVRFVDAIEYVVSLSSKVQLGRPQVKPIYDLVEVGPHSALRRPFTDIIDHNRRNGEVRYSSVLYRNKSPIVTFLTFVGNLFTYGYGVSIIGANQQGQDHGGHSSFLTDTPQYPFDRSQRY